MIRRITEADIEEVRARGYDSATMIRAEEGIKRWKRAEQRADNLILQIDEAFDGVTLGDGIGLWESDGIDDYACGDELRRLREKDEKQDWRAIPSKDLSYCNAAPSFLDARGWYFHAPAFMTAELRGEFHQGFADRLLSPIPGFINLLMPEQRHVVMAYLSFYASLEWFNIESYTKGILRYSFPIPDRQPVIDQNSICLRYGGVAVECANGSKFRIAKNVKKRHLPINAFRIAPTAETNGWYIWAGALSDADDFFKPIPIEQLDEWCPAIVPYLNLPPGWRVQLAPNHEDAWFDSELIQ